MKIEKINQIAITCIIILTCYMIESSESVLQPPYQVRLHLQLHPKAIAPIHICNGVIIQNRLILTSAACVYYQFVPNQPHIQLHPSQLKVIAGSDNAFSDALTLGVAEIRVLKRSTNTPASTPSATMANDLAILRLRQSLPLSSRDDMKWIILDDDINDHDENNDDGDDGGAYRLCVANFYSDRNKHQGYFTQAQELQILNTNGCSEISRNHGICAQYILPDDYDLNELHAENLLQFNSDRGTALICHNHLTAILSMLFLPATTMSINKTAANAIENAEYDVIYNKSPYDTNSAPIIKAWYTNVRPHLSSIYEIIAYEEYNDILNGNYTISTPYKEYVGAIIAQTATTSDTNIDQSKPDSQPTIAIDLDASQNTTSIHSSSGITFAGRNVKYNACFSILIASIVALLGHMV